MFLEGSEYSGYWENGGYSGYSVLMNFPFL